MFPRLKSVNDANVGHDIGNKPYNKIYSLHLLTIFFSNDYLAEGLVVRQLFDVGLLTTNDLFRDRLITCLDKVSWVNLRLSAKSEFQFKQRATRIIAMSAVSS